MSEWALDLEGELEAANERGLTGRWPWIVMPDGRVVFGEEAMLHEDLLDREEVVHPGTGEGVYPEALALGVIFRGKAHQYRPLDDGGEWEVAAQEEWDERDPQQTWKTASWRVDEATTTESESDYSMIINQEEPRFKLRRPVWINDTEGRVIVGQPGTHHEDLLEEFPEAYGDEEWMQGMLYPKADSQFGTAFGLDVMEWGNPWEAPSELMAAIASHLGAAVEPFEPSDWKLGAKTADADHWWQPAQTTVNEGVSMGADPDGQDADRGHDAENWAYLDGRVAWGGPHWDLIEALARDGGSDEEECRRLGNLLARGYLPQDRDAAYGATVKRRGKTYPQIQRSNVDRNAVWDAVAAQLQKTAAREEGVEELKWLYERRNGQWHWWNLQRGGPGSTLPAHTELARQRGVIAQDDHVDWGRFVPGYVRISYYGGVPVPSVRAYGQTAAESGKFDMLAMEQLKQMYPGLQTENFTPPPREEWALSARRPRSGHQRAPLGQRGAPRTTGSRAA